MRAAAADSPPRGGYCWLHSMPAAQKDEITPPHLCAKYAKAYTNRDSAAEYRDFKGRGHFICGEPGWEEVATYIGRWIEGKWRSADTDRKEGVLHATR
jgi:hypothetical protein